MLKIIYSFVGLKVEFKHNRQILESSHQITTTCMFKGRAHRNSLGYELELFLPGVLSLRNQWRLQVVIKCGQKCTHITSQKQFLHLDFCTNLTNEM